MMRFAMLELKNISISIEDNQVVNNVSLSFETGKNYCILGKNGSGKSSLSLGIMGHPKYEITDGDIILDGESILEDEPNEKAEKGIFLAFQSIPEVKGVKLFEFLRTVYNSTKGKNESFVSFKKIIEPLMSELHIDKEFLWRDLNVGFSGGERRKIEILQLKLLNPKYIILDEVDSGLDVDAFRTVAGLLKELNSSDNCFIIITHYFTILDYLPIDTVYLLEKGRLVKEAGAELAFSVKEKGFES